MTSTSELDLDRDYVNQLAQYYAAAAGGGGVMTTSNYVTGSRAVHVSSSWPVSTARVDWRRASLASR